MRKSFSIQLPGYQIFQLNRSGFGGGLLTAVDEQLDPVLVNADDEVELLIVQVKVGVHQIRVFNAYGPQETNPTESLNFWLRLEQEIIRAKQDNCWILIEMDANAKLDSEFHKMTENGKLMLEIVERQNLVILNKLPICQGQITRHRITKYKEEKAILDYTLTCNELSNFVETMMIDDGRLFTLTKYVSTRGFKSECKSDHNPLFSSFNLEYETKAKQSNRREIFNLKDEDCQKAFNEETNLTTKFTDVFEKEEPFEKKALKFQRCLKQSIQKCFRKVRIRTVVKESEVCSLMKMKTKLQIFMQNSLCDKSLKRAQKKIYDLEEKITDLSSARNVKIVQDYVQNLQCCGKFSQNGMWKIRKKLHPSKQVDPPMAKKDAKGNVITAPHLLKKLYLDTYKDRLRHRDMKQEFEQVYYLKTELWDRRLEWLRTVKSPNWSADDLEKVLKKMKNDKSRDPHGLINEIFKPGVIGSNLQAGLLYLANGVKENFHYPGYMQWANITTIFKNRGSRFSLDSDRGIFGISILKKIIEQLIYTDKFEHIDKNMSDSNIGGRRKKSIKNHLFIVYGIINSVVKGDAEPVDIQIYDIEKAFDALWLQDTMNDLMDTIPTNHLDNKMALLYEGNMSNMVAVNTGVGQTDRVNIPQIVMQGGTWGPIMCSNSIDRIGKKCHEEGKYFYLYKNRVRILPLGMVDDLLAFSSCGHQSVATNTYLTTQCELKKLRFHIPDEKGKSKCHQMHVGKHSVICPDLKIHGHLMEKVHTDSYLGDIISNDGSNSTNIKDRIGKGHGCISDIMSILDTISFGHQYFKMFILLREAMFINKILTNAEIWYGVTENQLSDLEDLDRYLIRKAFKCPVTTPKEAYHLELGILPIGSILKCRRLNYLHYIVKSDENGMLFKFFNTMYENPSKDDWSLQTVQDLKDLKINEDLSYIKSLSAMKFKKMVKMRTTEFALDILNEKKFSHSKMENLLYTELEMQNYLVTEEITTEQKRIIFQFRTRMSEFDENYGNSENPCKMCFFHRDSQSHSVNCNETMRNVKSKGNYNEIFANKVSKETARMLEEILETRKNKLS